MASVHVRSTAKTARKREKVAWSHRRPKSSVRAATAGLPSNLPLCEGKAAQAHGWKTPSNAEAAREDFNQSKPASSNGRYPPSVGAHTPTTAPRLTVEPQATNTATVPPSKEPGVTLVCRPFAVRNNRRSARLRTRRQPQHAHNGEEMALWSPRRDTKATGVWAPLAQPESTGWRRPQGGRWGDGAPGACRSPH